jgi:hypothetical protein
VFQDTAGACEKRQYKAGRDVPIRINPVSIGLFRCEWMKTGSEQAVWGQETTKTTG